MDWLTGILVVALSALGAALGSFLKEYFASRGQKEGEIDAVARNLNEVLRQLRETTKATEQIRMAVSGQMEHDREIFRRYDNMLPEQRLLDELNGELYNKYSSTRFTIKLKEFTEFAEREEGRFLAERVQTAFSPLAAKASELRDFVAHHFFTLEPGAPPDADGHHRLALYPEFRHKEPRPGDPDWDARAEELDRLCEEVGIRYTEYRRSVKEHLTI